MDAFGDVNLGIYSVDRTPQLKPKTPHAISRLDHPRPAILKRKATEPAEGEPAPKRHKLDEITDAHDIFYAQQEEDALDPLSQASSESPLSQIKKAAGLSKAKIVCPGTPPPVIRPEDIIIDVAATKQALQELLDLEAELDDLAPKLKLAVLNSIPRTDTTLVSTSYSLKLARSTIALARHAIRCSPVSAWPAVVKPARANVSSVIRRAYYTIQQCALLYSEEASQEDEVSQSPQDDIEDSSNSDEEIKAAGPASAMPESEYQAVLLSEDLDNRYH